MKVTLYPTKSSSVGHSSSTSSGIPASTSRDFLSSAKSRPASLHASNSYADAFGTGAVGGAVGSQGSEGPAFNVRIAPALHIALLFQALGKWRERATIQAQAGVDEFQRHWLIRLPQHQHDQVLRIGQPELRQKRAVGAHHYPAPCRSRPPGLPLLQRHPRQYRGHRERRRRLAFLRTIGGRTKTR